jgi:hypothetical protein
MKTIFRTFAAAFILVFFLNLGAAAEPQLSSLLKLQNTIGEMRIENIHLEYERKHALIEFLEKYLTRAYIEKNIKQIESAALKPNNSSVVYELLKDFIADKKERRKIAAKVSLPQINQYKLSSLKTDLTGLIELLRYPTGNGYKFVEFSKSSGGSIDKQKLVAQHTKENYQSYHKSFTEKLYRIHIFSPKKSSLFYRNRDTFLNELVIDYWVGDEKKNLTKKISKFLKIGESFDVELPEIADKAEVKLTFACKKEHRKKAIFYVEVLRPMLTDNQSSPFYETIQRISRLKLPGNDTRELESNLAKLQLSLNNALSAAIEIETSKFELKNTEPQNIKRTGIKTKHADNLKYFKYMLNDENVSRDELKAKFKQLFSDI